MADAPDSIEKCIADLREELAGGGPTGCWQCLGSVADRLEAMLAAPPSPPVAAPADMPWRELRPLMVAVMNADAAMGVGYLRGTSNWAAVIAKAVVAAQPPRPGTAPLSDEQMERVLVESARYRWLEQLARKIVNAPWDREYAQWSVTFSCWFRGQTFGEAIDANIADPDARPTTPKDAAAALPPSLLQPATKAPEPRRDANGKPIPADPGRVLRGMS